MWLSDCLHSPHSRSGATGDGGHGGIVDGRQHCHRTFVHPANSCESAVLKGDSLSLLHFLLPELLWQTLAVDPNRSTGADVESQQPLTQIWRYK